MTLHRDEALELIPVDTQADIERMLALWSECRAAVSTSGPFLLGKASAADAFSAPVAVRLRSCQVVLPPEALAYIETFYQWPVFQRWQQAAIEEVEP